MHVLPQLRKLERRYANELQVISIHSPKFPTERETANLRKAVLRLRVEHPVLNDRDFQAWQAYGATAWPTMVFIDPAGNVIGMQPGELTAEILTPIVEHWLTQYREGGLLTGPPLDLVREHERGSGLAFPGKVEYDSASGRLFVADSNNDRILVADLDGAVVRVVGGGGIGADDGPPERATFNQPQGMTVADGALYVADLENHLIRRIDLESWETVTVAGTGEQSRQAPRLNRALAEPLNSPWDVASYDGRLYIAMAGFHQLWLLHPDGSEVGPWAGSGAEGIVDGPRERAELAQPSGLAVGPNGLTFADSESSAVREVTAGTSGRVVTFVGRGLFDFGDADGSRDQARLQHPLDVAWVGDDLFVADTFNHKIKQLFPRMGSVTTLCGGEGYADGPLEGARFNEPGGLCAGPGRSLIVADTNNHAIRMIDLDAREVRTIPISVER